MSNLSQPETTGQSHYPVEGLLIKVQQVFAPDGLPTASGVGDWYLRVWANEEIDPAMVLPKEPKPDRFVLERKQAVPDGFEWMFRLKESMMKPLPIPVTDTQLMDATLTDTPEDAVRVWNETAGKVPIDWRNGE